MTFRNPMQAEPIQLNSKKAVTNSESKESRVNIPRLNLFYWEVLVNRVINEMEYVDLVGLDALPEEENAREAMFNQLLDILEDKNGKHYVRLQPSHSGELLERIEARKPGYTNEKAEQTNSVYVDVKKVSKLPGLPQDFSIDILKAPEDKEDTANCEDVAAFQYERLIEMRPNLGDETLNQKRKERYSSESLISAARSQRIFVVNVKKDDKIVATTVFNQHAVENETILDDTVYMSSLIIDAKYYGDEAFLEGFIASAMKSVSQKIPSLAHCMYMAPGKKDEPLVKCIEKLKEKNINVPLDKDKQKETGIVIYFVGDKDKQSIGGSKTSHAAVSFWNRPAVTRMPIESASAKNLENGPHAPRVK